MKLLFRILDRLPFFRELEKDMKETEDAYP